MLWDAAVLKATSVWNLRITDLIDVIGPREDPCLCGCFSILTQPAFIMGTTLESFDVDLVLPGQVLPLFKDRLAA
jgi:hypothetical protein